MRVLQLSDLHMYADPAGRVKNVPTRETFADVLAHVDAHESGVDLYVITGDLTHDEQLETYRAVRAMLGDKVERCRVVPGNHDDRRRMRQAFPDAATGTSGTLQFSLEMGGWRLIGLDSHAPGEISGRIERAQLDWLERELQTHAGEPTALFLHHPPIPVGVPWMDRIGLQEPEEFRRLVESSPQVKLIACGHVHHEFAGRLGAAAVYATPSTGVQFVPAGETPDYEAAPPGYRVFEFDGPTYQTCIVRLPEVRYVPEKA